MRLAAAVAASVLFALAAPAVGAPPPALLPVQVTLDALPGAVRTAIAEAQHRITTDVAQGQLEQVRAYVQGFERAPSGQGGLADPAVRDAYAWAGRAVELLLAVPEQLQRSEASGASCEASGRDFTGFTAAGLNATAQALERGQAAGGRMAALAAAARSLEADAPLHPGLDLSPYRAAVAELAGWVAGRGQAVRVCLDELAVALAVHQGRDPAAATAPKLAALLVPSSAWRGGRFAVLGTWAGEGPVRVQAPSLQVDLADLAAGPGATFEAEATVPRGAALGDHAVEVSAGGQAVRLPLQVLLAPSLLVLQAPAATPPGQPFVVQAQVTSPAGAAEVDAGALAASWNGTRHAMALAGGIATVALPAPESAGLALLEVHYAGTDVVAPAVATAQVALAALPAPPPADPPALQGLAALVALAVLAAAAAALGADAWRRRARAGAAPPAAAAGRRPLPALRSFAGAVGLLFAALRRLRRVPPGRTVREWAAAGHAPQELADAFDAVRYGGQPEPESLRERGIAWVRRRWERL